MDAYPSQMIHFFNGFKQSVIPLFQRPYEWEAKNWEALWQDILERYGTPKEISHFMGTIVTTPSKSVPTGVSKHLVIDGQQRLTTLAIFLCALRDELPPEANTERTRIQNFYLVNEGFDGWDYLKILPTQDDRPAFKALIEGKAYGEQTNIHSAYKYFVQKLKGVDNEGIPIDCKHLLSTIEGKLIIVSINLSDADDPYLIFESLNYKGFPLTQADLVRNYFLMRFPTGEQEDIYANLWLPMQRRLGENLTEFMRQFLMRDGEEVLKGEIYSELKKRLQELDPIGVRGTLAEMYRISEHYLRLVKPDNESDTSLQDRFYWLLNWEVTTVYPFLLKLYDAYSSGLVNKNAVLRCLQIIESYVVRRTVCNVPTNQLKKVFLLAAKDFQETKTASWLESMLAGIKAARRWPKDEEFKAEWMRYKMYGVPKRCRLILQSLEQDHGHKEPAALEEATTEHVLPQELTNAWRSMLGNNAEAIHELYCDTIGNLTLTAYNSELSNSPFEKKKAIYADSHYELNKWFAKYPKWTQAEIEKRSAALWERAINIWPGPPE